MRSDLELNITGVAPFVTKSCAAKKETPRFFRHQKGGFQMAPKGWSRGSSCSGTTVGQRRSIPPCTSHGRHGGLRSIDPIQREWCLDGWEVGFSSRFGFGWFLKNQGSLFNGTHCFWAGSNLMRSKCMFFCLFKGFTLCSELFEVWIGSRITIVNLDTFLLVCVFIFLPCQNTIKSHRLREYGCGTCPSNLSKCK